MRKPHHLRSFEIYVRHSSKSCATRTRKVIERKRRRRGPDANWEFGSSGRTRTYNPSVNSRISRRSCAKRKTQVVENRSVAVVELPAVSHGLQEKFVQKFVQCLWVPKLCQPWVGLSG